MCENCIIGDDEEEEEDDDMIIVIMSDCKEKGR
jgi:hypothetical protein